MTQTKQKEGLDYIVVKWSDFLSLHERPLHEIVSYHALLTKKNTKINTNNSLACCDDDRFSMNCKIQIALTQMETNRIMISKCSL